MKKLILNHKSNLNFKEITDFKKQLDVMKDNKNIILFPSVIYLSMFTNCKYKVGSQNFYSSNYGNYTGEISLESLKDLGVKYTMINHFERTSNSLDTKRIVKEKLHRSLIESFDTILFIGESKNTKEPFKEIKKELNFLLKGIEASEIKHLSIMYEPTWINNSTQNIDVIRKVVVDIKEYFINKYSTDVEVYYGSGVGIENISEILEVCDGVGLGKNSLNIKDIEMISNKIFINSTK